MPNDLFREWDLYDRITRANHMRHAEIAAAARAALARRPGPLRVLDLGCGDGYVGHQMLAEADVSDYVGVDLSEQAVERLGRRPAPGVAPDVARRAVCGDIAAALAELPAGGFDVVLAGFSLHHFPTEAKPAVLAGVARALAAGGWLVWTDTYRAAGESRAAFVDRLATEIRATWTDVTADEREAVIAHIAAFDHPEPEAWMAAALAACGLGPAEAAYRDGFYLTLVAPKTG